MTPQEVEACLEVMEVLVDRRERPTAAARRRFAQFKSPVVHATLDYGDYAANCTLPGGRLLHGREGRICADVVVERKMNLDELAICFGKERARFNAEFERAAANHARVYLLIENATWEGLYAGKYRSRINPKALAASIQAWTARYDIIPLMCKAETSGRLIKDILYRELKEALENGKYDKVPSEEEGDGGERILRD